MHWAEYRTPGDHQIRAPNIPCFRSGMGGQDRRVGDLLCLVLQAEESGLQMEVAEAREVVDSCLSSDPDQKVVAGLELSPGPATGLNVMNSRMNLVRNGKGGVMLALSAPCY